MKTFADSALAFISERPDARTRESAWKSFLASGLPTTADEVWRYAPLHDLDLDHFDVTREPADTRLTTFATQLSSTSGLVVRILDGFLVGGEIEHQGVKVRSLGTDDAQGGAGLERYGNDAFAVLNLALAPATTVIEVADGVDVPGPIVILYATTGSASFSRTRVRLGRSASVTVVEYFDGGADALVVPVSEYEIGDNAALRLVTYQRLDSSAWHVARTTGLLHRDSRLNQAVIGMGGHYNRSRNDAELLDTGAENELRTTFLGTGNQVHDFRTHQFHKCGRTRSTLLSKGAVADQSRSVYTGLIEIEKGAKRTDARQTNHNLLLSPHAHADSVPNLDIRENDVMCAHASSVGPLDELQRWYLESRGVSRRDAERLMIQGFFNEMLTTLPADLADLVEADVTASLADLKVVAP
ncbi:MAG: SufD family Fe-S cluster assembly protein [Acidimicrobiales bacterium]